jgi:hypothetical protein
MPPADYPLRHSSPSKRAKETQYLRTKPLTIPLSFGFLSGSKFNRPWPIRNLLSRLRVKPFASLPGTKALRLSSRPCTRSSKRLRRAAMRQRLKQLPAPTPLPWTKRSSLESFTRTQRPALSRTRLRSFSRSNPERSFSAPRAAKPRGFSFTRQSTPVAAALVSPIRG